VASWRISVCAGPLTLAVLVIATLVSAPVRAAQIAPPASSSVIRPEGADFRGQGASRDARRVADWVASSGDNQGLSFIIVDKVQAKVFVFDAAGRLDGASRALMGVAKGDDTVPGVGAQRLATIRPDERITPAGRFVARMGRDYQTDILWIDYNASLSLHRVVHGDANDHRLRRLATDSAADKRISYGCINVPAKFYDTVVLGAFRGSPGIVYILPEVKAVDEVFPIARNTSPDRGEEIRLGGFARATPSTY
jgi:hypothetical protein